MIRILKYALLAVLLAGTVLYLATHYIYVWQVWESAGSAYLILIVGFLAAYLLFLSRKLSFLENLMHECTHLLFAALLLKRINSFYVSPTGGIVNASGYGRKNVISLAPYFFPLLTLLLVVLFTLVSFRYSQHLVLLSYVWYLVTVVKGILRIRGEFYSSGITGILMVVILNFWISLYILSWCTQNDLTFSEFLKTIQYEGV